MVLGALPVFTLGYLAIRTSTRAGEVLGAFEIPGVPGPLGDPDRRGREQQRAAVVQHLQGRRPERTVETRRIFVEEEAVAAS
jgi:hypothetical protein